MNKIKLLYLRIILLDAALDKRSFKLMLCIPFLVALVDFGSREFVGIRPTAVISTGGSFSFSVLSTDKFVGRELIPGISSPWPPLPLCYGTQINNLYVKL